MFTELGTWLHRTQDMEKMEILNTFFVSLSTSKAGLQEFQEENLDLNP